MGIKIKLGVTGSENDSDPTSVDDAMALSYTDLAEERAVTNGQLHNRKVVMEDGGVPIRDIISAKVDELERLKKISPPNVTRILALERNIASLQAMLTNQDEVQMTGTTTPEEVFELGHEIYTKQQIIDLKIEEIERLRTLLPTPQNEISALESEIAELRMLLELENLNIPVEPDPDGFVDDIPTKPNLVNPLISRPRSHPVRNVTAISAFIAASVLGAIVIKNCVDNDSNPKSEPVENTASSATQNISDNVTPQSHQVESSNSQLSTTQSTGTDDTLWTKVVTSVDSHSETSGLDLKAKIRLEASSTNDLVAGLRSDAHTWSDSPEALKDLKAKVTTWGGYDFLLASGEACNATSITQWLSCIDSDVNVPNSHLVVKNFEGQIQAIQDETINPDQKTVKAKLASIATEQVNKVVEEKIANPPEIPKNISYPSSNSASVESTQSNGLTSVLNDIYDAPDPITLMSQKKSPDPTIITAVPTDMNAPTFEDRFEAIEPLHVFRAQPDNPIPSVGDPFEAIEPANIIKSTPVIKEEVPLVAETDPVHVEQQKKGFLENTVGKVSNWIGNAKKWFA